MLTALPTILFGVGLLLAVLREGWWRLAGTIAMLAVEAVRLTSIGGGEQAAWVVGPIVASAALMSRAAPRLSFERLMLRSAVTAGLVLAGGYFALRLPLGERAWTDFATAWVMAGVGLSWVCLPRDRGEARRGAALAIAGGGAMLLSCFPAGLAVASLTGIATLCPLVAEGITRYEPRGRFQPLAAACSAAAAATVVLALASSSRATPAVPALTIALTGTALTGTALLLTVAAFAAEPAIAAAVIVAAFSLMVTHPALQWAALAGALTILLWEAAPARRLWAGLVLLGLAPALELLVAGPLGARWQAALLGVGWVVLLTAPVERWIGTIVLTASTFFVAGAIHDLPGAVTGRFAMVALAGAALVVVLTLARPPGGTQAPGRPSLRASLTSALILTGVGTHSVTGLVGAVLLLIDLGVVHASAPSGPPASGLSARIGWLARSGWPGSAAFAGRVLTVLSAVAAGPLPALVAVSIVGGLQLMPLWDATPPARPAVRAQLRDFTAAAISIAAGLAPVVVSRMLQGS
ncbi:MAG TPA: hypothetical protein VET65_10535 [Candidatus Limnocylindrales bacterium]|nr:hypothetical protein [Candidatus Limnocylindrales bacterium]